MIVTRRFEGAIDALLDHYGALRHLHPDAGSRALKLIEVVEHQVPLLLGAQPDIGRRVALNLTHAESEINWLSRLAPLTVRRRLQAC